MIRQSARAREDLLITQYEQSTNLKAELQAFYDQHNEIADIIDLWVDFFDIDQAYGHWLEVIGIIVGVSRETISNLADYYGYENAPGAQAYDVGVYWDGSAMSGDAILTDEQLRQFIKAKIIKNNTNATLSDVRDAINYVFPDNTGITITDNGDMTADIDVTGITAGDANLLEGSDILPRPAGVAYNITSTP